MNENPTDANEQYELGKKYFYGGGIPEDKGKAVYWYTKSANQGYVLAQYILGVIYWQGDGVHKDLEKAIYWFTKAAEQGDEMAEQKLNIIKSSSSRISCYVATCVYGSYDCPEVWTLRRFRDSKLSASWLGMQFIRVYYAISPKIIKLFGNKKWFNRLCKPVLNRFVCKLQNSGIESSPYSD